MKVKKSKSKQVNYVRSIDKPITKELRAWYFGQPANTLAQLRARIIAECNITNGKFYNWLYGRSTPNRYEREFINSIAGKPVF